MLTIDNANTQDPHFNLAIEEHFLRHLRLNEPVLLLYVNAPSVIVGRHQNIHEEIDPAYVEAHQLPVVRRLSGGGAVYHDLGNLNFSFITPGKENLHNFVKVLTPVIEALHTLGVTAVLQGKSNIYLHGKKISGNAQYATNTHMVSHGTLLFNTNLENLIHALNPSQQTIESKAVQSIRALVTNISDHLPQPMTMAAFRQAFWHALLGQNPPTYTLLPADWEAVHQLVETRYRTWDWNYGRSPDYTLHKNKLLDGVACSAKMVIGNGRIQNLTLSAPQHPHFSQWQEFLPLLIGQPYHFPSLAAALPTRLPDNPDASLVRTSLLNLLY